MWDRESYIGGPSAGGGRSSRASGCKSRQETSMAYILNKLRLTLHDKENLNNRCRIEGIRLKRELTLEQVREESKTRYFFPCNHCLGGVMPQL